MRSMYALAALVVAALALALPGQGHSAEMTLQAGAPAAQGHSGKLLILPGGQVAVLQGMITHETVQEFALILGENPGIKTLVLDSPGGLIVAALNVAAAVNTMGLATFVPEGSVCASACSILFFAGQERLALGEIGVHQMSDGGEGNIAGIQFALAELLDAFERFGVDRRISRHMLTTLPTEMYYFSEHEKAEYGINRTEHDIEIQPANAARRTIDFADHPARTYLATPSRISMPDFSGRDRWARNYRTRIREGLSEGPNFAGHYTLIEIGCGTNCRFAYVADAKSGQVLSFPYGGEENYEMQLLYSIDSRLLKATWMRDWNTCVQQDLLFDGAGFAVMNEITFPRMNFCN